MRTTDKTVTFTFIKDGGGYEHNDSSARLCGDDARRAFDLGKFKTIYFEVTNSKPKNLADWHHLHRWGFGEWRVMSTTPYSTYLLSSTMLLLANNFPDNTNLYVSAYT
jgi:hypothetical protein